MPSAITWTVSDAERAAFARFSGDHNPIHQDPVGARRLHGGRLLVHGAHVLLAVVEQAIAEGHLAAAPRGLTITFRHGIEPDMPLTTSFVPGDDSLTARVTADVWPAADIEITLGGLSPAVLVDGPPIPLEDEPHEHDLDRLNDIVGTVGISCDPALADSLFPLTNRLLGSLRLAEVARISCVVGMRAPGRYSMSSRYEIEFTEQTNDDRVPCLEYRVEDVDVRMRRVQLGISGPTMTADALAFSPPGPVDQRQVLAGGERPEPAEFAGRRVLVVGGSRGLGAAAVHLLAEGGAEVRFTHLAGQREAAALAGWTGATAVRFDVLGDVALVDVLGEWQPTHVCWFASPPRSGGVTGMFSDRLHAQLLAVMVTAFERAVGALAAPPLRGVLWPSSEVLARTTPPPGEVVSVLRAGEAACERLVADRPGLVVHARRLPRLRTDQTTSLLPVEYADTASVMLAALRALPG